MIELQGVEVGAGTFRLRDVNLEIAAGEFAVLMGRTGSGKTTLLEAIAGLLPLRAGRVRLAGRDVSRESPAGRGIGYVPQDGALFSSLTVAEHLEFGPRFQGWSRRERRARAAELAASLGIEALAKRRPTGLSGGERQRVALGRALAARPPILLLDEPLSALDEETRAGMCELLQVVAREVTTLYVTHASSEAERLGTTVLRMESLGSGPERARGRTP